MTKGANRTPMGVNSRRGSKGLERNFVGMTRIVQKMIVRRSNEPRPQAKAALVDSHGNYTYCY